jgi:thiamine pyrophosphate-dependent acetolactate synthase large subunit-like protein
MSMQELGTIKHYDLGIKIILFNNSALGMVREMQKKSISRQIFTSALRQKS